MKKDKTKNFNFYNIINNCLRLFIIISIIVFIIQKEYSKVGFLAIAFVLTFYDWIIEKGIKIKLGNPLKFSLLFLIFTAQCLGSVYEYYGRFPWWDTIIHGISGIIFFYIGLTLIEQMNNQLSETKIHPVIQILFAICFSLAIGVIWEFFEFAIDKFAGGNMQTAKGLYGQDAIWDTIQDLLAATIGTIIGTIAESIQIKRLKNRKGEKNDE